MLDKLAALEARFLLISDKISDPAVIADIDAWREFYSFEERKSLKAA